MKTSGMKTMVGFPPFADYVASQGSLVVIQAESCRRRATAKTNVATMLSDWESKIRCPAAPAIPGTRADRGRLQRRCRRCRGGRHHAVDVGTDIKDRSACLPLSAASMAKPTETVSRWPALSPTCMALRAVWAMSLPWAAGAQRGRSGVDLSNHRRA